MKQNPFRFFPVMLWNGLLIILLVSLFLTACTKEDPVTHDTLAPSIQLNSPADGASFPSGNPVSISFRIEENDELHTWGLTLVNLTNDSVLLDESEHQHDQVLDITRVLTATVAAHTPIRMTVVAEDHSGNEATAMREFSINP